MQGPERNGYLHFLWKKRGSKNLLFARNQCEKETSLFWTTS